MKCSESHFKAKAHQIVTISLKVRIHQALKMYKSQDLLEKESGNIKMSPSAKDKGAGLIMTIYARSDIGN